MPDSVEGQDFLSPYVQLPEVLDLKAAAPLVSELLRHRGHALDIDASQVIRLGGQCLQVLLSAVATWHADEVPLSITHPSTGFMEGLELLGISAADFVEQGLSK